MDNDDLEYAIGVALEYESREADHTDGYYSAYYIRVLYKEILRLRKLIKENEIIPH